MRAHLYAPSGAMQYVTGAGRLALSFLAAPEGGRLRRRATVTAARWERRP